MASEGGSSRWSRMLCAREREREREDTGRTATVWLLGAELATALQKEKKRKKTNTARQTDGWRDGVQSGLYVYPSVGISEGVRWDKG